MEQSRIILLFMGGCPLEDLSENPGPSAILHESRTLDLFELQRGQAPLAPGVTPIYLNTTDTLPKAIALGQEALSTGRFPMFVSGDRQLTSELRSPATVILAGRLGRPAPDEIRLTPDQKILVAGVRAASSTAFSSTPGTSTFITAHALRKDPDVLRQALSELKTPVHLCVDLDVLSPAVLMNERSIEPGGLTWYELADLMDMVAAEPGIRSVDITGTRSIFPGTVASRLCAQMVFRTTALFPMSSSLETSR